MIILSISLLRNNARTIFNLSATFVQNLNPQAMKKSEINFNIELDEQNVPENILWNATDKPGDADHTKAISIAVWDDIEKNTMRLDLWTKDMPILEMKKFYIDALGGMSQSLLAATGDDKMANSISELCDSLSKDLEKELNQAQ